ncbi:reverse transcriptase domain-containing protein [Legionella cincinnatiensis]|uniref:Retron-type reverse transcriptase n=1 Tax=Legionella cincinnatiensis TaxID=28085 RepID=A0A378IPC8_9GAMM|nr:reverse transcriptase domain-containing protein [Legionella cincinnatiensis]KTC92329.1 Reverse transcriptase (RNA-dependent DNA polymerase) [Legionella cincinnatiensis]STX36790.1 Retron-type reverse transcriptase [Legionella cincinnatiensis]
MNNEPLITELQDKTRCIQRISKLYNKLLRSNRIFEQDQAGINISDIYADKKNITKILIRELLNGCYQPMQYDERKVYINSKTRLIANYSFIDRLLLGILYDLFRERTLHLISPSVYSYISGRSAKQAIQSFCAYLKQVRTPNKQINVYVLRADITNYGGSIPADTHAIFWNYFYDILKEIKDLKQRHCLRIAIEEALRPILHTEDNLPYQKIVGIPVGSPLATLIYNLYLSELDDALANIPYGFYARYSDDFIYAHTDINQFKEGEARITAILEKLRLQCNPSKNQRFYLTHAGKSSNDSERFIGSNRIELCGLIIFSDGTKTLKHPVIQKMLRGIKHRLINATPMLTQLNLEQRGQALCQIVNNLLNEKNPFQDPTIRRIFKEITNRGCLKQIDYSIALIIVELLTGIKGVRAFRKISYATLRNEWHLTSLCREKNYWNQHKFSFRKNGVFTDDKDKRFI